MFSPGERTRVRAALLARAREDDRIVAAAIAGSHAAGREDRWSDVDLAFGLAEGVASEDAIADWTAFVEREFGVLHHFDLRLRTTVFRVFLLPSCLQVDLAFTPGPDFASYGPAWRTVFGSAGKREPEPAEPLDSVVGLCWLSLLHARVRIERGKPWEAEYWLSTARDKTLELACSRLGLPTRYARGFDGLPPEVTAPLEAALARSLEGGELRRALRAAAEGFLLELGRADDGLRARLERAVREIAGSGLDVRGDPH